MDLFVLLVSGYKITTWTNGKRIPETDSRDTGE